MKLHILFLGEACIDKGAVISPGVDDGKRVHIPIPGYLIQTDDGKNVLIDTGMHKNHIDDPEYTFKGQEISKILLPEMRPEDSMVRRLAALDLSPQDIHYVINTHLHFDHCGQNAVFSHAPCYVQRSELDRAKRESPDLYDWFGFMNARWELLDGDTEILPGLSVITTPGHTVGHQCVVVAAGGQPDLLIGDAAYTPHQYAGPADEDLPPGQASDVAAWRGSLGRIRSLAPERVHFCHHTDIIHGG
jgi:N-acyl homoserine lactone hydrolase